MNTTTIYRINEKDRTIDIAQSVKNIEDELHGAVLNTRSYTFDELMNQHRIFCEHTEPFDTFRNRLHSALRVGRSIEVNTDDMIGRFIAEYGENIFLIGFVNSMIEFYDKERQQLLKPSDVILAKINKSKTQQNISSCIDEYFNKNLNIITNSTFFDYSVSGEYFEIQPSRTITAFDGYTFNVFHESDNCLITLLAEIGQIVHRNKWKNCQCGFCRQNFLDTGDSVCCHSDICINAQAELKKKICDEDTEEYSKIKRTYDAYVRRYMRELRKAGIDRLYPDDFDEFVVAKQERQADMNNLKKKLFRNGLPADELEFLSKKYKSEIRTLAENILLRHEYDHINPNKNV